MNTYIQNKLDEFDKTIGCSGFYQDALGIENYNEIRSFIEQSLTDYNNHIVENIDKLNKDAEKFVPFQKIHYQSALNDLKSILQDTNPKE
jgi:hypothetical protein